MIIHKGYPTLEYDANKSYNYFIADFVPFA